MISFRILLCLLLLISPGALFSQETNKATLLQDIQYFASDNLAGRKPLTKGNIEAGQYIKKRFEKLNLTSQYRNFYQWFTLKEDRGNGEDLGKISNIVGFIPGTESSKVIVITAHYDHLGTTEAGIYNGADDNASGTAGLLALAAYFSKHPPKASMVFAALNAEEMGLQGGRALVRDFPLPLEDVLLNVNMDMISRSEKNELYAAGTGHYPKLKTVLEKASRGSEVVLRFGHDEKSKGVDDWTYSSDHAAFHEQGIPFVYFGVEDHEDYHQPSDTFEHIDQEFYYETVNLIIKCVRALDDSFFK